MATTNILQAFLSTALSEFFRRVEKLTVNSSIILNQYYKSFTTTLMATGNALVIGCSIGGIAASVVYTVSSGRQMSHQHLHNINETYRRYQEQCDQWEKDPTPGLHLEYVKAQRQKDKVWYEREMTRQKEWLDRPFYRQIGMVPPPEYL
jgi:hypothetical protein